MEGRKQVAVIGGDARQAAAGRALARAGYAVCGAEQVALADYILLPLPLDETRTPLAELLRAAKPGALALGGRLSAQAKQIAQEAGVELVDYFAREELTIRNAIPTAEGCLGILLRQRKRTLWGSGVLVTGFGPVGQALGPRLAALGADVTVAARRPAQRALAESLGLRSVPLAALAGGAPAFDTVVNTIPAVVLTEPVLAALRPGSLLEMAVTWVNLAVLYEKAGREEEIDGCLEKAVEIFRSGEVPRDGYYAFNCRKCAETFGHFGYFRIKKELTEAADRIYREAGEEPGR